ncbi:MAG: response regulator [Magnetococcales bacterium]|nr:response regulator [Magnetococcales bacterium]MBF0116171.1 response regulator [Magnetococcales bacterium]
MEQLTSRELGKLYKSGEVIFQQGERADSFFSVQRGQVLMTRQLQDGRKVNVEIGPGEIFGIASVFTAGRERFGTAVAIRDSVVIRIDDKRFVSWLHQDPSIAFRVIRHLSQRLFEVGQSYQGLNRGKVRTPAKPASRLRMASQLAGRLLNVHNFSVGYHFLIVEDDPEFYELLCGWLKSDQHGAEAEWMSGYNITLAKDLESAENLLGQEKYDLILLDLNLPDSEGYSTFMRVEDNAIDTPIIVLTAMDDDHLATQAVEDGAEDYLVKQQMSGKTLVRAVSHALSRHRRRKESAEESKGKEKHHFLSAIFG